MTVMSKSCMILQYSLYCPPNLYNYVVLRCSSSPPWRGVHEVIQSPLWTTQPTWHVTSTPSLIEGWKIAVYFWHHALPQVFFLRNISIHFKIVFIIPLQARECQGLQVAYKQSSICLPPRVFSSSQVSRVVTVVYLTLNDVLPLVEKTEDGSDRALSANTTIVSSTVDPRPPVVLNSSVKVVLQNRKVLYIILFSNRVSVVALSKVFFSSNTVKFR